MEKLVKISYLNKHLFKTFLTIKFLYINDYEPNIENLFLEVAPKSVIIRLRKEKTKKTREENNFLIVVDRCLIVFDLGIDSKPNFKTNIIS